MQLVRHVKNPNACLHFQFYLFLTHYLPREVHEAKAPHNIPLVLKGNEKYSVDIDEIITKYLDNYFDPDEHFDRDFDQKGQYLEKVLIVKIKQFIQLTLGINPFGLGRLVQK